MPLNPTGQKLLDFVRSLGTLIPLSFAPDTPRSAWDAIASGLLILENDTEYHAQLSGKIGGFYTVRWCDRIARRAAWTDELFTD